MPPTNPSTARVGLAKYERFHMHFRPNSTSWMIAAERLYWPIPQGRVLGGSFTSVRQQIGAVSTRLAERNEKPKGMNSLVKIQLAKQVLPAHETGQRAFDS